MNDLSYLHDKKLWIFDLDNCLYHDKNMQYEAHLFAFFKEFLKDQLNLTDDELNQELAHIRARGLHFIHGWNADRQRLDLDLLDQHVAELSLELVLGCCDVKKLVSEIHVPKIILTNGLPSHAARLLPHMGFDGLFDDVFAVCEQRHQKKHFKPHLEVYLDILQRYQVSAEDVLFLDDTLRHLEAAASLGIETVLVHNTVEQKVPHHQFETLKSFLERYHRSVDRP